jgi:hypothetical protein
MQAVVPARHCYECQGLSHGTGEAAGVSPMLESLAFADNIVRCIFLGWIV